MAELSPPAVVLHMIHHTYHDLVHRVRTTATGLLSSYPAIRPPLYRLRDTVATLSVASTRLRTRLRHTAPTNPYRIFWVDPAEITQSISWQELSENRSGAIPDPFGLPNYHFAGRVLGGQWDSERRPFAESVIYRSFRAHFEDGTPWIETDLYNQCLDVIGDGGSPWGCESAADLERRCHEIDQLYETISTTGYCTQTEIATQAVDQPLDHARTNTYAQTIDGEIALTVGRDGELLFYDGRNRLAIAKLAGSDSIPVVILARHRQWQQLRDAVATGKTSLDALDRDRHSHPDLVGIAPPAV